MPDKENFSRGAERKQRLEHEKKKETILGLAVVLILIMVVLGGTVWYFLSGSPAPSNQLTNQSVSAANTAAELLSGSPPISGSTGAPVTIVEFGDFQCPSCGEWFRTQESQIVQNLVQSGKAKLEWRDFDYYGPDSTSASEATYAAGEQGKFWQMHDLLYSSQQTPNNGWASRDNLVKFAQQLGLNMTQFNNDFNSGKYVSLINENYKLGTSLGVSGTPTFFVIGPNGKVITIAGGQPYSVFETAVNTLING